jgi:hypothetical protein
MKTSNFKHLVEHRYSTSAASESFAFIAGCLHRMGYETMTMTQLYISHDL